MDLTGPSVSQPLIPLVRLQEMEVARTSSDSPSESGNALDQSEVPDPVSQGSPFIARTFWQSSSRQRISQGSSFR